MMFLPAAYVLSVFVVGKASDAKASKFLTDFNITQVLKRQLQDAWVPDNKPRMPMCPGGYVDRTNGCAFWWDCAISCPGNINQKWASVDCSCACVKPEEKAKLPALSCPTDPVSAPVAPAPAPSSAASRSSPASAVANAPRPSSTGEPTQALAQASTNYQQTETVAQEAGTTTRVFLAPKPTPNPATSASSSVQAMPHSRAPAAIESPDGAEEEEEDGSLHSIGLIVALAVLPSLACCFFVACLAISQYTGPKLSRVQHGSDASATEMQCSPVSRVINIGSQPEAIHSVKRHHLALESSSVGKLSPTPSNVSTASNASTRPPSPVPSNHSQRSQRVSTGTGSPAPNQVSRVPMHSGSSNASAGGRSASARGRRPSGDSTPSAASRASSQPNRPCSSRPSTSPRPPSGRPLVSPGPSTLSVATIR